MRVWAVDGRVGCVNPSNSSKTRDRLVGGQSVPHAGTARSGVPFLQTPKHDSSFALQFGSIPVLVGSPGILQTFAVMRFQHSVLAAKALLTETAVSDYGLCGGLAALFRAARLI